MTANSDSATHVLGVDIGTTTFKELMFALQLLAEPALFQSKEGKLTLGGCLRTRVETKMPEIL